MPYNYDALYQLTNQTASNSMGSFVWVIVSLVVSIIGCFLVYFLFLKKEMKNEKPIIKWLRDFLNFDKMLIEPILKIAYIFTALFITLSSFALIGSSFLTFILTLAGGNIIARVGYEFSLILVMLWRNTTEIKNRMKK